MSQLEDELTAALAEEFKKSEDFEVLCSIMTERGWIVVETEYYHVEEEQPVIAWAEENCVGHWQSRHGKWLFEDAKDATMFKLKWG